MSSPQPVVSSSPASPSGAAEGVLPESSALEQLSLELLGLAQDPPRWRRHLAEALRRQPAPHLIFIPLEAVRAFAPLAPVPQVPAAQASLPRRRRCGRATARSGELPRYLTDTYRLSLTGASERQIAVELGLSRHSVHEYVKRLYRHFGVKSRAQLIRLAAERNAED